MEPIGLAVGIAGLGGLFTTCLDAVQRIDSYKDFGRDSRSLAARFDADRLRLERWGDATGIRAAGDKAQSGHHHLALDDPATRAKVNGILSIMRDFYSHEYGDGPTSFQGEISTLGNADKLNRKKESKRQKLSWALGGKSKRMAQVEQFDILVQKLYELVPITTPAEAKSEHEVDKLEAWTTGIRATLERVEEEIRAETRRDLHAWLGCGTQEDVYINALEKRVSGTCDWILSRSAFVDWLEIIPGQSSKVLWVNGTAGFGKTVLCAWMIQHLVSTLKTPIAYFFLTANSESRDNPYVIIRSWVSQLIASDTSAFELVRQLWLDQSSQTATRAVILSILAQIVQVIPYCTLVLDGLDECSWFGIEKHPNDESISVLLRDIISATENTTTRILVVSRDEPEIRQGFDGAHGFVELRITPEDVQNDTILYSQSIVDRKLKKKDDITKTEISRKLAARCQGQFLWLKLQENSLRSWKNKKQIEDAIDKTPSGLEYLYERNWARMARLPDEEQKRAYSLLRWVIFALRPLQIRELAEALLIDLEHDDLATEEMPDLIDEEYVDSEILGLCGSLLEIRPGSGQPPLIYQTIHLTHFSVKEYFLNHSFVQGRFPQGDVKLQRSNAAYEITFLAKLCIRYLDFPQAWADYDKIGNKFHEALAWENARVPFRRYAMRHWFQHASAGDVDESALNELIKRFFGQTNIHWHAWGRLFGWEQDGVPVPPNGDISSLTPLHYASSFGLTEIVRHYIESAEYDVNVRCRFGRTPLSLACRQGRIQVVRILLEANADLEIPSETPLELAIRENHVEVAKLLIQKGANFNTSTRSGWTMLNLACLNGSVDMAKALVDAGADAAAATKENWSPLHSAATEGNYAITKILLDLKTADIDLPDERSLTPLNQAAHFGHADVAELLLKRGANPRIASYLGLTPLNSAAKSGHTEVVKVLLEAGDAGIDMPDQKGHTPLNRSAREGHGEIAKLLIEHGADIEAPNPRDWTPLMTALECRHPDIAVMLLKKGARVNAKTSRGRSPLMPAAAQGYTHIVEMMLEREARIDDVDQDNWNALMRACSSGQSDVVKILIDRGANLSLLNSPGWDALTIASLNGHSDIVKALAGAGAQINVATLNGWTPLSAAADDGHLRTVETLLDCGALIDFQAEASWTALMKASEGGHLEIVKLLVGRGADINIIAMNGMAAVDVAFKNGRALVVEFLLSQGAQLSAQEQPDTSEVSPDQHNSGVYNS